MEKIKLAISPCPNDTFIFGALIRKDINVPFEFDVVMEDIQLCNNMALSEEQDVVKVSFGVFPLIKNNYKILKCGGALGFGCGPLVLSKKYDKIEGITGKKVAIPGENTTAFAVFKKFYPECADNIENYVDKGVVVDKENKLITGQGPAFCMEFALAILEELKGKAVADEVRSGMLLTK